MKLVDLMVTTTQSLLLLLGSLCEHRSLLSTQIGETFPRFSKIQSGMLKFTFAVPSNLVRPKVEGGYSQKFRTYKYKLRKTLNGKVTAEDILSAKPRGCRLPFWEAFVENVGVWPLRRLEFLDE